MGHRGHSRMGFLSLSGHCNAYQVTVSPDVRGNLRADDRDAP
jgi:hypothetical protein